MHQNSPASTPVTATMLYDLVTCPHRVAKDLYGDPKMKQRILDYNEDDCRATRWLLDGVRGLSASANEILDKDMAG